MPMPMPHKGEPNEAFMHRCMGDETMMKDFPDDKQRVAVCMKQAQMRDHKAAASQPARLEIQAAVVFDFGEVAEADPSVEQG